MRILMVAPGDEENGGVQNVIGNLTQYLQGRGHDVVFLYTGSSTVADVKTNRLGLTGFHLNLQLPFGERSTFVSLLLFLVRFPIGMYQLIRIIRKNRIQIINVHYPAETACYFAICRRILSIRLVTSVHGADLFPGGRPQSAYPRAIRLLLSGSDRVVAPSGAFRKDVANLFPSLDEKLVFIHNGVNFDELSSPCGDSDTESLGRYVLCVAMHNEKKGLDVLLRAFAQIEHRAPLLELVLVGDGPLRGELEALATSLGIIGRVKFLGRKGRPQVSWLMQNCEVFVLPSRSEPFGIVVIEAMASRKPVVATRVGGIPEIVEDGKNGLLVEPDDPQALAGALVTTLENHELRRSMADNGYRSVHEKFSSAAAGLAYESLFANVAQPRAS